MPLQRPQVVVDELPRQADATRQHRRGRRFDQRFQEPRPHRVEQGLGRGGILDDRDRQHDAMVLPTRKVVKKNHRRSRAALDGPVVQVLLTVVVPVAFLATIPAQLLFGELPPVVVVACVAVALVAVRLTAFLWRRELRQYTGAMS